MKWTVLMLAVLAYIAVVSARDAGAAVFPEARQVVRGNLQPAELAQPEEGVQSIVMRLHVFGFGSSPSISGVFTCKSRLVADKAVPCIGTRGKVDHVVVSSRNSSDPRDSGLLDFDADVALTNGISCHFTGVEIGAVPSIGAVGGVYGCVNTAGAVVQHGYFELAR